MKYELRIPATYGDVVPLVCVADAMAKAASTAYGKAPPHKPAYNGRLPMYVKLLLNESRAGRLRVCNQFEHQGTAEELISVAKSSGDLPEISRYLMEPDWEKVHRENPPILAGPGGGEWDLTGIDLGPTEVDWDSTHLGCLCAKLHHLNEWGRANGDEFVINSDVVKWIDERGVMATTAVTNKTEDHPTIRTDANTAPEQRPATPAPVGAVDPTPDPERRLALLRALGGSSKYARAEWTFKGMAVLVAREKVNGFKRCDEKTIRADLKEAAQAEREAKSAGPFNGLG